MLPSGINLTQKPPPTVTGVTTNPDGTLTITGTGWAPDTLLYFDGLPVTIVQLSAGLSVAVVQAPAGASGQSAVITAYNSDGQNSQLLQSASPVVYNYGSGPTPSVVSVSPASLPAGAEAAVTITTTGMTLTPGATVVGFGTTDVVVRRVFVIGPEPVAGGCFGNNANAALSNPDISIVSGFQIAIASAGFQIAPAVSGLPVVIPVATNATPGLTGAYGGATVTLNGSQNLVAPGQAPVVTLGGQPVSLISATASQLTLQIPPVLPVGPAILTLNNGAANAWPVAVNVDNPPATIVSVQNAAGVPLDTTHAVRPGDLVTVTLSGFAPAAPAIAPGSVQVSVGGALYTPFQLTPVSAVWQVTFVLDASVPPGTADQLVVYLNGMSSLPSTMPVTLPNGTFSAPATQ